MTRGKRRHSLFPALSQRIRMGRKGLGWTQAQLAEAMGMAFHTTVANWERGTSFPTVEHIEKMATLFGVSPTFLMYGESDIPNYRQLLIALVEQFHPQPYAEPDLAAVDFALANARLRIAQTRNARILAGRVPLEERQAV